MNFLATTGLFVVTAIAEIADCYLPYLWLRGRAPVWVLIPAAVSLVAITGMAIIMFAPRA